MSDNQSNLTGKEMEDLQNIVTDTLASICDMADKIMKKVTSSDK